MLYFARTVKIIWYIIKMLQEWSIQGLEPAAGRGVYSATRRNIGLAQDFVNRMEASGG
jgi:hypothetical protein